ncbi:MAG: NUDIX hydrolase [Myxococcaceae bacterium]|nr:NUDIX hydrolase [Myxococcaceae bacterium]
MPKGPVRPWKKLGVAYEKNHTIFTLRELRVEDPRTGKAWPRVTIDAPDWVNVVAVTDDEQLVMIRQFRFGTWATTLEIPGGMLDPGEDGLTAGARELEEETGYRPRHIVPLGVSEPNPATQNNRLHHFLATGCTKVHAGELDESEDIEVELVPVSQVDARVRSGEITHSLVVTALYYWRLNEGR